MALARNASDGVHSGQDKLQSQQIGTFTRWWNSYLEPRGYPVTDLCAQIQDGVIAFRLLEALEGFPAAPVHRGKIKTTIGASTMIVEAKPKMKLQRADNLNQFVKMITGEKGIHLVNIGGEDLEMGKPDLVLGLTWELIKFYEGLGGGGNDEIDSRAMSKMVDGANITNKSSPAHDLLEWVRKEAVGVNVAKGAVAWTSSFKDGQVFAAIMYRADSQIFGDDGERDYAAVKALPDVERLDLCFDVAQAKLDVPKLLVASEVAAGESDSLSMTTYVAKLRKAVIEHKAKLLEASEEQKAVRRAKAEAAEAARKAALEAAEADRLTAERLAAEKAAAEAQAAAEKAAAEAQAEAEKIKAQEAAEKAAQMAKAAARAKKAAAAKRRMSILAQNNAAAALKAVAEVTAAQVTEELSAGGKASAEQMQALNAGAAQADAAAKAAEAAAETAVTIFEEEYPEAELFFMVFGDQQSAETTAAMAEVAAVVQATADAAETESPVDVPTGWKAETIVLDKKSLETKMGLVLLYPEEEDHPIVYEVDEGGTAATPECQLEGKIMPGDRILALEAANHVVHVDTKLTNPEKLNADTLALLKKCVGHVKLGIVRDGEEMVVSIDKQTKEQRLGLGVVTDDKHTHPFVAAVDAEGQCVDKIKINDVLMFIEAGTDVAQLQTRYAPDNIKHKVTTTFLKAVVGHIKILVHRMADEAKRDAQNAALRKKWGDAEASLTTTDTAPVMPQKVANARQSRGSVFMSHLTTDADEAVDVADAEALATKLDESVAIQ